MAPICRGAAPLSDESVDEAPSDEVAEAKPVWADSSPELVAEVEAEVAEPVGPVLVEVP